MRYTLVGLVLAGMILAAGCISTRSDVGGFITLTKSSGQAVDGVVKSTKVGTAEAKGIIIVAFGDSSVDAACKQAGITKIHYIDYETVNILGLYGTVKTTVYGE
jgi:hypothetical protein